MMTPDDFRQTVLPRIVSAWDEQCFCANPGFHKLLSFNFRDYGIGPVALADSEILIDEIIRQRFTRKHGTKPHQGELTTVYICPQCEATCTELWAEFSIHMYQSTVTYDRNPVRTPSGLYLVGFYGLRQKDFDQIEDFHRAESTDEFIGELKDE